MFRYLVFVGTLLGSLWAQAQSFERVCWIDSNGQRHCEVRPIGGGNPPPQPPPVTVGKFRIGDRAYNTARDSVLVTIVGIDASRNYVLRFEEGALAGKTGGGWSDKDLASLYGCGTGGLCAGDQAFNTARDSVRVQIVGVSQDGTYVIYFQEGTLAGKRGGGWDVKSLATIYGCGAGGFCVGDRAINTARDSADVRILGITYDGRYIIEFQSGALAGKTGGNWEYKDLASTRGCAGMFCVGDTAYNIQRNYVRVRITGLQFDGRYVIYFLEGPLAGKSGGGWDASSLARAQ